jgi:Spy/CpxP family protein refolding chaperone
MRRTPLIGFMMAVLAAGLLLGPTAHAQPTQPTQPGPRMGRLQQKLGLTDDQLAAIRDVYARQRDSQRKLYTDLRNAQTELRRLALNGADAATLSAKSAEVQQLLAQGLQLRIQALQEIGQHLTPEQRDKFASLGADGWMHHRHGPGPRPNQPAS